MSWTRWRWSAWPLIPLFDMNLESDTVHAALIESSGNRYPGHDAHRVAALADEELAAWDAFIASVQAKGRTA